MSLDGEPANTVGPQFALRLFGAPALIRSDGVAVTGPAVQRHRLALLALLAMSPRRTANRDRLVGLLWPEKSPEQARQLLNQAIYQLRRVLGDEALRSTGDELELDTRIVAPDVLAFDEAVGRAEHERAASLHEAPFLDAFYVSEAPEFEHWVERERARLGAANAQSVEALATAAERAGDFTRAATWWMRRAALDSTDSRVARQLMLALDAAGNRGGALQHYDLHCRLLDGELGVQPPQALTELAERMRRDPAPVRPPVIVIQPAPAAPSPVLPGEEDAIRQSPYTPKAVAAPLDRSAASVTDPEGAGHGATAQQHRRGRTIIAAGVAASLAALTLLAVGLWREARTSTGRDATSAPSIVVLPLARLGGAEDDDGIAAGLTEELIGVLARTSGVRVIASSSAFAFRDRGLDVRSVADSLGVTHALEGGVQRSGPRVRVRMRLVDARDRSTIWSDTYDRELGDVFAVYDEVARIVANELGVRLTGQRAAGSVRAPTENVAAYELYLRGSDRALLRSDSAARLGLEYFRQATALDSSYAAAHAGLGRMYLRLATSVPRGERAGYFAKAEEAAQRAIALDSSLAEAQATLALLRMSSFDFAAAERHLTRAAQMDPSSASVREWLVTLHLWRDRPGEALASALRAVELDPLSPTTHAEVARALLFDGRCDEALARLDRIRLVRPPVMRAIPIAAQCHVRGGNWDAAADVLRPHVGREATVLAQLGYVFARDARREEAIRVRDTLLARWRAGTIGGFELALVSAGLGDVKETLRWLEVAVGDRSLSGAPGNPTHLVTRSPYFEQARRDPTWREFTARLQAKAADQ